MAFRRFKRPHRYTDDAGAVIVIPRGWAGELKASVAAEADKAGATVLPEGKAAASEQEKPSRAKKESSAE